MSASGFRPSVAARFDPSAGFVTRPRVAGNTVSGGAADVHAFLRQSPLMVPLNFVRGTPDRTIEHTLMGVPVVASRLAVGGVDAESVTHFLVADSPREYSGAILRIMNDPAERPSGAVRVAERAQ